MKAVIQRVNYVSVYINGYEKSAIKGGLLVLIGVENNDSEWDIDWICNKIVQMRIFNDKDGKMNISIKESGGDIMLVSQFTLFASTQKGNRPSFSNAAKPAIAIPIYHKCIEKFELLLGKNIFTGEFGADMKVNLENDGPVTIIMDSKNIQ